MDGSVNDSAVVSSISINQKTGRQDAMSGLQKLQSDLFRLAQNEAKSQESTEVFNLS
jgi:hypothetical protein